MQSSAESGGLGSLVIFSGSLSVTDFVGVQHPANLAGFANDQSPLISKTFENF